MPRWLIRPLRAANAAAAGRRRRVLLGGAASPRSCARFWHKEALLVRGAVPGFAGLFSARRAVRRSRRATTSSRGSSCATARRWTLAHGPFRRADFKALPARNWTLLVQGVNLHRDAADALLRRFAFLPYARLDDLMVSYAAPGGGVGPHFDSYDVFLLQGFGRRRWRYGRAGRPRAQARPAAQDPAPLRAGARRRARSRATCCTCRRSYAHDGVARRRVHDLLDRLPRAARAASSPARSSTSCATRSTSPGRYADPDLAPTREPARIGAAMQRARARAMLAAIRWDRGDVARFLGCWLSEPKPHGVLRRRRRVRGRAPRSRRALARARRCASTGARSCSTTTAQLFVNGERAAPGPTAARAGAARGSPTTARCSRRRAPRRCPPAALALLHDGTAMATSTPPPPDGASAPRPSPRTRRSTRSPRRPRRSTRWSRSRGCRSASSTSTSSQMRLEQRRARRAARALPARARATRGSRSSCTTRAGSRRRARACSTLLRRYSHAMTSTGPAPRRAARWTRW